MSLKEMLAQINGEVKFYSVVGFVRLDDALTAANQLAEKLPELIEEALTLAPRPLRKVSDDVIDSLLRQSVATMIGSAGSAIESKLFGSGRRKSSRQKFNGILAVIGGVTFALATHELLARIVEDKPAPLMHFKPQPAFDPALRRSSDSHDQYRRPEDIQSIGMPDEEVYYLAHD